MMEDSLPLYSCHYFSLNGVNAVFRKIDMPQKQDIALNGNNTKTVFNADVLGGGIKK